MARIMITATGSGCGKTTITCGILWALKQRGLNPKALKCGPDYIDPMFHKTVMGISSGNLDSFFMDESFLKYRLQQQEEESDICLLEGAMGFFDGIADTTSASAYEVALMTGTPSVLIINCRGMGIHSVLATLCGYLSYRTGTIRGVIFNQLSANLYNELKVELDRMIQEQKLPRILSLGCFPKIDDIEWKSRHLGLITPQETAEIQTQLQLIGEQTEKYLDIEQLLQIAGEVECITEKEPVIAKAVDTPVRIAVANDSAFCFYYEENLQLLKKMGAEPVYFSPLSDTGIPKDCSGVYLGGGYPELYGKELSKNRLCRESLQQAILEGLPVIAECGGFLYLHETLQDETGKKWPMVGVVKGNTFPTNKLGRFGYITLEKKGLDRNSSIKGHEFHYWDSTACGSDFIARKAGRNKNWECGYTDKGSYMGFPHLFFYSNPEYVSDFLKAAAEYREKRESYEQ